MRRGDQQAARVRRPTGPEEGGFTLVELLVIIIVLGVLASIVVFALAGVGSSSTKSACSSDARTVDEAAAAYLTEHPDVTLVTQNELTAPGTGTLQSWPAQTDNAYSIEIASAGQVGTPDANHHLIATNDVLVQIGANVYDATASVTGACASVS